MKNLALNKSTESFDYMVIGTQWGDYLAVASEDGLCWLMKCRIKNKPVAEILADQFPRAELTENSANKILKKTATLMNDFITGKAIRHTNLPPLDLRGTEFQQKAWKKIAAIPHGETISYKDVAAAAGNENAVRAGGSACGKNPIPYLIPCHRVIGHGGNLGGFAWGLDEKRFLLKRENAAAWPTEWDMPEKMTA